MEYIWPVRGVRLSAVKHCTESTPSSKVFQSFVMLSKEIFMLRFFSSLNPNLTLEEKVSEEIDTSRNMYELGRKNRGRERRERRRGRGRKMKGQGKKKQICLNLILDF